MRTAEIYNTKKDEAHYLCLNCPRVVTEHEVVRGHFFCSTRCQREFRDTYGEKSRTLEKDYKRFALGMGVVGKKAGRVEGGILRVPSGVGALVDAYTRVSELEIYFQERESGLGSRSPRISRLLARKKERAESQGQ